MHQYFIQLSLYSNQEAHQTQSKSNKILTKAIHAAKQRRARLYPSLLLLLSYLYQQLRQRKA